MRAMERQCIIDVLEALYARLPDASGFPRDTYTCRVTIPSGSNKGEYLVHFQRRVSIPGTHPETSIGDGPSYGWRLLHIEEVVK